MLNTISQIMIFVLSLATTIFLVRIDKWKKWGYITALLAQPFWFYSTYLAGQWGMFGLTIVNCGFWIQGIYNYWIRKQ